MKSPRTEAPGRAASEPRGTRMRACRKLPAAIHTLASASPCPWDLLRTSAKLHALCIQATAIAIVETHRYRGIPDGFVAPITDFVRRQKVSECVATRNCAGFRQPQVCGIILGRVNEKTEPPSGGWTTQMRPPCVSISLRAIESPRPAPACPSRERALSPR